MSLGLEVDYVDCRQVRLQTMIRVPSARRVNAPFDVFVAEKANKPLMHTATLNGRADLVNTAYSDYMYMLEEAFVLRLCLLEDRGRIIESIRILVPVDKMKQNVFRSRRNKSVDRSSFSSVGSLFHARGAATEKALSPIRRRVCVCLCMYLVLENLTRFGLALYPVKGDNLYLICIFSVFFVITFLCV